MLRRAKIVATLGPSTDSSEQLTAILLAGVDIARINFSHGSAQEHLGRIARFRAAAEQIGKVVAVLADLPGPKLRVILSEARLLREGEHLSFAMSDRALSSDCVQITEPEVLHDVRPGQRVLLDDGRLQLEAIDATGDRLTARVVIGGMLHPNKGLNLPDTQLSIAAVTRRDEEALRVAAEAGADWLALSFVRSARAAEELRQAAVRAGFDRKVPILAKVERPEAVNGIAEIVEAFDAVMVARGDLGVEMPLEQVPVVQKQLIRAARHAGKPVITATDMLDSMRNNPRPTRAEAGDVANAVFDGTDAVMLSGETAIGKYPVETVTCMAKIVEVAETQLAKIGNGFLDRELPEPRESIDESMALIACNLAQDVRAAAIVTPTLAGRTARLVARYRPAAKIVAPAPSLSVVRKMAIVWGLRPVPMATLASGESRLLASVRDAFRAGEVKEGDRVVVLAGHPLEAGPLYPTVRVMRVGEAGACEAP